MTMLDDLRASIPADIEFELEKMGFVVPKDGFLALGNYVCRADAEGLIELISSHFPDLAERTAVEIGCWTGFTTRNLADAGLHKVYAVDHFHGNDDHLGIMARKVGAETVFAAFCSNLGSRLYSSVFPLYGSSADWAHHFAKEGTKFDVIFQDAGHSYAECSADIKAWRQMVEPGGLYAVHDYDEAQFPGVVQAVNELLPGFQIAGATIAYVLA